MGLTVAIVGAGAMGSAIGRRLVKNGCVVIADLEGRSADSVARAAVAGVKPVNRSGLAKADFVLSIVPPDVAVSVARELAPLLGAVARPPVFIDCNATQPREAVEMAKFMEESGVAFVDGSIIGSLPTDSYAGPTIYVSGARAGDALVLNDLKLIVKSMGVEIGAASAIKMCYGAITKGHIAIGAAMILAAERAGVRDALLAEMELSLGAFLDGYRRSVPDMFSKARRWVPEMKNIAAFLGESRAEHAIWEAAAAFYVQMADDYSGEQPDIAALSAALHARGQGR